MVDSNRKTGGCAGQFLSMFVLISIAILSVWDKSGLLELAKSLNQHNVRLLATGGTAKMLRDANLPVEYE